MAICLGRRSARGRLVTLMLMWDRLRGFGEHRRRSSGRALASLSRRGLRQPRERVGEREEGSGFLDAERPHRGSPEALAVGITEVRDQAPNVGPRRALDLEFGPLPPSAGLLEAVHGDLTR